MIETLSVSYRQAQLAVAPQPPPGGPLVRRVIEHQHGPLPRPHDVQVGRMVLCGVEGRGARAGAGAGDGRVGLLLDEDDVALSPAGGAV